jgi:hypothetical protein
MEIARGMLLQTPATWTNGFVIKDDKTFVHGGQWKDCKQAFGWQ